MRSAFVLVLAAIVLIGAACGDSSSSEGEKAADRVWMQLGAATDAPQFCVDLAEPGPERDRAEQELRGYEEVTALSDTDADVAVAQIVELCEELVEGPRATFSP